jgi:hypothetical protein
MPSGNLYVAAQVQVQAGFGDDRFNEADDSELEYVDLKGVLTVKIVTGAGMGCLLSRHEGRGHLKSLAIWCDAGWA